MKMRVHLLWSTKYRRRIIDPEWRLALFEKLVCIPPQADARVLCVGGVRDHVHLLLGWSPAAPLSDVARDLKTWSSRWIRQTIPGQSSFHWQSGYSAFTVYHRDQSRLIEYLLNQEPHHGESSRVGGWVARRQADGPVHAGPANPALMIADAEQAPAESRVPRAKPAADWPHIDRLQ